MSPKRKPLVKAHALFYKGLKAVGGSESKINVVHGNIQISFFVGGAMAAKYTSEGEGLAGERLETQNSTLFSRSVPILARLF